MTTLSTAAFSKSNKNTHLATEASIIGWPALYAPELLTIESEWTGRSITLEKTYTEKDNEGDIILWMYKPANKSINLTVEVFND